MYSALGLSLYPDNTASNLESQPLATFTTPGIGHFVQNFALFVPLPTFEKDVKEVEKGLVMDEGEGGFEINSPLVADSLVGKLHKKKGIKRKGKGMEPYHKGHGKLSTEEQLDQKKIDEALNYPIKVP